LATQSLNSLIYSLRRQLAPALGGEAPLLYSGGCYQLNVSAGIETDIARFEALVQQGNQSLNSGEHAQAMRSFHQAVDLYHGDLRNAMDIYAVIERERLRACYLTLLAQIADHSFEQAEYGACLTYAQRLLVGDPCREDAHRLIMRCYLSQGQRAQALRHYRFCIDILQAELGIAPEPATIVLYEQIRENPYGV
jgi:DNA-binding SARP family transcriptional activator